MGCGMKALITGINGQDGSYLAEYLLRLGYEVHGTIRKVSTFVTERIDHIMPQLHLYYADMSDASRIEDIIAKVQPDELYNLAGQSHVGVSYEMPSYTTVIDALGPLYVLEAVRKRSPHTRVYQASTSELFGQAAPPQNELTPMRPISSYGCAKLYAHELSRMYRDGYNIHISCGITFNHESPRRNPTFVTRKITQAAARIKAGLQDKIRLFNLDARRDWGFAGEYVEAFHLLLQQDEPDDYVIATGHSASVGDFLDEAFRQVGLDYRDYLVIDERQRRPMDVPHLCGDASKIRANLNWQPKVRWREMVSMMLEHDMATISQGAAA